MIRRLVGVVLVSCAFFVLPVVAQAEVPPGPRLTFMEAADSGFKLISSDPGGGDQRMIVGGNSKSQLLPFPFSPPRWSGDGTRVTFTGIALSGKEARLDIYDAAADGTGVTR